MKVGVIGLGSMGKNHARVLVESESVSEVKLYDPLGSKIGRLFDREVNDSLGAFLEESFDYCVVSSPTTTHLEIALELAQRKIPALIEKPIAFSVEEAERIMEAFDGVIAGVGHVERYNPAIVALQKHLASGALGKIFQITTRRVGPFNGRIRDVGVVKDLASHDIDLVASLSGSTYKEVFALLSSPLGNSYEDSLLAIGELENGVLFSHVVNWISPTKERVTTVLGESGLMVANTLSGDLLFYENKVSPVRAGEGSMFTGVAEGEVLKLETSQVEPLAQEHVVFQNALATNNPSGLVSLEQGLEVLRVAERMLL